ncbi:hypothetical protein Tco_0497137 [Tanacetum coccineum]
MIDFETALELQKQLDEREEVTAKEAHDIDWSDPSVLRYHALQNRPYYVAEVRKNMCMYLKNQVPMLYDFNRQDVLELYRLVKDRFQTASPEGYDLLIWGDMKTLIEPNEEDEIWRNQQDWNLINWKLHNFCGVHVYQVTSTAVEECLEKSSADQTRRSVHARLRGCQKKVSTASTNLILPEKINTAKGSHRSRDKD